MFLKFSNAQGRRQDNIDTYQDTMRLCRDDPVLAEAIKGTIAGTVLYPAGQSPRPAVDGGRPGLVSVTKERSIEAAARLHAEHPDWRIAVHNFASATNPGGGVERGSNAQEESICRITTLHPCLKTDALWKGFYRFHRNRGDVRYTDAAIYTPDVVVMKTDTDDPKELPTKERFFVDIITCAAPNLRERPYNAMNPGQGAPVRIRKDELKAIHAQRAEKILKIAMEHKADGVVLGAFGCGAFCNDPTVVAQAYREIVQKYPECFETLVFAVYCTPRNSENYEAFRSILAGR